MYPREARCPFCGRDAGFVYVSAHEQCAACGQVVEPCCTGEQAQASGRFPERPITVSVAPKRLDRAPQP